MKRISKLVIIALGAAALILMVRFLKTERASHHSVEASAQDSLFNVADSLIENVSQEKDELRQEIDSMNNLLDGLSSSSSEYRRLIKEIEKRKVIQVESIVSPIVRSVPMTRDSVSLRMLIKDTVVYNIIRVDSVVRRTVYKIDTIIYKSEDIKTLRLK